jgi:hypothetical protein
MHVQGKNGVRPVPHFGFLLSPYFWRMPSWNPTLAISPAIIALDSRPRVTVRPGFPEDLVIMVPARSLSERNPLR